MARAKGSMSCGVIGCNVGLAEVRRKVQIRCSGALNARSFLASLQPMKIIAPLALILALAACTTEGPLSATATKPPAVAELKPDADAAETPEAEANSVAVAENPVEPVASVAPKPPVETARTVEEFDTTTPAERAAAAKPAPVAKPASGDGRLGTTVASLGAAGEPGFWIKTPLVKERMPGRLFYAASGRNVQVQLIPSGGSSGAGSQVSLAAMRLLDAPLDGLPELVVYTN